MPFDALTTLLVIEELFKIVLSPYRAIRGLGVGTFRTVAVGLCGVAVYTAYAAPGNDYFRVISALVVVDRSTSFVEVGLLVALFAICAVLGIAWRSYHFGIATGMGISVAISLINAYLRAEFGSAADPWYGLIQGFSFNLGMAVWLYYFATKRSTAYSPAEHSSSYLAAWNSTLEEILSDDNADIRS
jgi:hypothetical protein